MPSPEDILANLSTIANRAVAVSVAWHCVSAVAVVALLMGWRPSNRAAAALLGMPLLSVSVAAWLFANPFNGAIFALAALGSVVLAARGNTHAVRLGSRTSVALGLALFLYAWLYPHFVVAPSPLTCLYAAPLGVIPCPTLSLLVAAALVGRGLVAGAWCVALALLAAFYALFGMLRLGVALDVGLLIGALALSAQQAFAAFKPEVRAAV